MKKKQSRIILAVAFIFMAIGCKRTQLDEKNTGKSYKKEGIAVNSNPSLTSTIGTNVQEFNELKDAVQEGQRMRINYWRWTNFDPTGFYIPANTTLSINVQQLAGTTLPKLIIGTYYRYMDSQQGGLPHVDPPITQLVAGTNTISSGTYGGMIWIRFTTTGTPTSKVKITFNSGHLRVPVFIKNVTTQADWNTQLTTYTSPDVLLVGDRVYQVYSRTKAQGFQPQDNSGILTTLDRVWDLENQLSGLDGSASQHNVSVHNRILITETDRPSGLAWAYYYGVYFTSPYVSSFATSKVGTIDGWAIWHEMGHEHQQDVWTWSTLGEVTNNIHALYVERTFGVSPSRLKRDNRWPTAMTYLASTDPNKDFNSTASTGINDPFIRLCMFQQLWLAFGDDFFIQIHKKARTDNPTVSTDAQKMRWFMLAACTVTGRDLTNFFNKWALKPGASVYTEIAALALPQPVVEPSTLNEDNAGLIENGANYKLISAVNNTSLLDVNSHTPVNGTLVSLWSNNSPSTLNQQWKLRKAGNGYFTLKSLTDTTKVLDVTGGVSTNGTQIQVYTSANVDAQKWTLSYVGNGYYNLSPACAPNSNLDINGGFSTNGTKVQIWSKNTGNAQKFKLVKQ